MKKLSIFMGVAAIALGFSSCSQDREPVYHDPSPSSFVLNIPAMQDQYIELTEGNTLELVTSQPDYGYSAIANYSAEVSLSEDFEAYEAIEPTNNHLARMNFKQEDVAIALCSLLGVESEEDFNTKYPEGMPYMPLYFRAVCQLEGVDGSLVRSNVVSYNNVKGYLAVALPGYIYMIGNVSGDWIEPAEANAARLADWRLFEAENAIGSHIYTGTFDLPSAPMFRFYTALTGWGDPGDSYGYILDDNATDFPEFTGDTEEDFTMVNGKGSYNFPNFPGGKVTIVVNMSDMENITMTVYPGDVTPSITTYVYMVGNNGGWVEPVEGTYEDWKLACSDGSGVYTNTFDFANFEADGGVLYCRFYSKLTGWGAAEWSSDAGGGNVECPSGVAMPTFVGEGCFTIPAAGHKIQVVLDTNLNQVTFTYAD